MITKFSFKVLVAVFASSCHIYVYTLFVLSLGYRFGNIATNVLGFAQFGYSVILLLAWPLKTRLAKAKLLQLISNTKR
jgi:hypothetical protein